MEDADKARADRELLGELFQKAAIPYEPDHARIIGALTYHAGVRTVADLMVLAGWPHRWPGKLYDVPGIGRKAVGKIGRVFWRLRLGFLPRL